MNNVVALHAQPNNTALSLASSPLMFTAYERPLFYTGKEGLDGQHYDNTGHKALVRLKDNKPVCLNVVRDTYKVVQNAELFDAIHNGLRHGVSQQELANAQIKDKVSYNGTQCFREYVFRDIGIESPEQSTIAFRIIVQNGFGTGAIKLYAGAIDFFCTNGLIIGDYVSTYAKHTSGLSIDKFQFAVRGAVDMFWKNQHLYGDMAKKKVLSDDDVAKWLDAKFGERLAKRLMHQFRIECASRGRNIWALYSALTHYASHNTGEFGIRNTGNDHEAATMMKRENDVRRHSQNIMELAA